MAYDTLLEKHRERFLIDLGVTEINRRKAFPELLKDWLAYYGYTQAPLAHAIARWASDNAVPVTAALEVISDNSTGLLWSQGEQGLWYDPSDMSTLFQDAAGTTPVTAMEQPVGLVLDKRLGLVRGVNLADSASTLATRVTVADAGNGFTKLTTTGADGFIDFSLGNVASKSYEISVEAYTDASQVTAGVQMNLTTFAGGVTEVQTGGERTLSTTPQTFRFIAQFSATAAADGRTRIDVQPNSIPVGSYIYYRNWTVRELPGNHASQTTTASKPVLSARKNLLLGTDTLTVTNWVRSAATVTANADGTFDHIDFAAGASSQVYHNVTPGVATVTLSVKAKVASGSKKFRLKYYNGTADSYSAEFTASTTPQTFTYTFTGAAGGNVAIVNEAAGTAGQIFVDEPQLEYGSTATRYQRVNTATDYDWVGFPMYLKFDGVDDGLVTNSIDFAATDKMTVVAGVRKLSDAAVAMIAELSANANANVGAFRLTTGNPANTYEAVSYGGVAAQALSPATYTPPVSNVATLAASITADQVSLRLNGAQAAASVSDQGAATAYGNYPVYIGRRGGTSFPFNGYLYQLGIRGALTEDAKLKPWERDTGNKTGVTIA